MKSSASEPGLTVKIRSFRTKAHLVFHWCLYNKSCSWRFDETSNKRDYDVRMLLSMIKFRATWLKILGDINLISGDLTCTLNHAFVSFQNLTLQSYSIIFLYSVVFVENKTRHFTTEIEIHGNLQSYRDYKFLFPFEVTLTPCPKMLESFLKMWGQGT